MRTSLGSFAAKPKDQRQVDFCQQLMNTNATASEDEWAGVARALLHGRQLSRWRSAGSPKEACSMSLGPSFTCCLHLRSHSL